MSSWIKKDNHHFIYSIAINSAQEKVWNALIDVPKWKDWDTELVAAELVGDFGLGAQGTLTPQKGPPLKFKITELTAGTSYTFKTKMPIGFLEIKRVLEVKDGLTHFTDDIQFTGFLKRFFGALLGRGFKAVLPEVMQNFKALVERNK